MRIRKFTTENAIVYAPKRPSDQLLRRIEERLASGSDALLLGTYPALSLGYIDPRDFSCAYPLSNAFAFSKEILCKTGGMDLGLGSMAATDLMRRIKAAGGTVSFAADLQLNHYDSDIADIYDQLLGCMLLDAKYADRTVWRRSFLQLVRAFQKDPLLGDYSRKVLLMRMPLFLLRTAWYRSFGHRAAGNYSPQDLRMMRVRGMFVAANTAGECPLVSVVIRTRHRPAVLRKTLECMRYQAYSNIELIVIEDGEPLSQRLIAEEFSDLRIRYYATVQNIGRARAANLGFSMATGQYINMLDDDDYLYPEHIYTGVMAAESGCFDMVFLQSLALLTTTKSSDPYEYDINEIHFMNFPRIDPFTMAQSCMTPNNGVLFSRKLFDGLGGMRPDLNAHEDWSLWLRFMTRAKWTVVPYATCCFVNPFSDEERKAREESYAPYKNKQLNDPVLVYKTSQKQLSDYYKGFIADWHCLAELGWLESELQKAADKNDVRCDAEFNSYFTHFTDCISCGQDEMTFTAMDFKNFYSGCLAHLLSLPEAERKRWIETQYSGQ